MVERLRFDFQMGGESSCPFGAEEMTRFTRHTQMDENQIRDVYYSWEAINDGSGIPAPLFAERIGRPININFTNRIFAIADQDGDGVLSFEEFLNLASILLGRASMEKRIEFVFRIYDYNDSRYITREKLETVLGEALRIKGIENHGLVEYLVEKTFESVATRQTGVIDFEEFEAEARRNPRILNCVQIDEAKIRAMLE